MALLRLSDLFAPLRRHRGLPVSTIRAKRQKVGQTPSFEVLVPAGRYQSPWASTRTLLSHSIGSSWQSLCLPTTILPVALYANVSPLTFFHFLRCMFLSSIYLNKSMTNRYRVRIGTSIILEGRWKLYILSKERIVRTTLHIETVPMLMLLQSIPVVATSTREDNVELFSRFALAQVQKKSPPPSAVTQASQCP